MNVSEKKNVLNPRGHAKSLGLALVDSLISQIRSESYPPGEKLPSETELIARYGVSRTVVREALSKLQAMGLVETRHGVGTFVRGMQDAPFVVTSEQLVTLNEVLAVLELRMGIEVEAAGLAALRRSARDLKQMQSAIAEFEDAIVQGRDAIEADYKFHRAIASATRNEHFLGLMNTLGSSLIPRSRAQNTDYRLPEVRDYLTGVNGEHRLILEAIRSGDPEAARGAMRIHLSNGLERRRRAASRTRS